MKVTVHKCPWSGKLFEDPKKYRKHLRTVRNEHQLLRAKKRATVEFHRSCAQLYEARTTDEIVSWLDENFMRVALHFGPSWKSSRLKGPPTEADRAFFEFTNMRFKENCSTSHSAPKGQKTTGWGRRGSGDDIMVPEQGWYGRIKARFEGDAYHYFDSDFLKNIGINTGSGGGGYDSLAYEVTLFTKDFPGLRKLSLLNQLAINDGKRGLDSNGKLLEPEPKTRPW